MGICIYFKTGLIYEINQIKVDSKINRLMMVHRWYAVRSAQNVSSKYMYFPILQSIQALTLLAVETIKTLQYFCWISSV